jgi:hypothetical protein
MACFAVFLCTAVLLAEDYTGLVKNVAKDKTTVTIAVDGADKTFDFSKDPLVVDDKGKPIPGGLPNVKLGSEVKLYTDKKGDKDVVTTLKVLAPPDPNFKPPTNAKGGSPGEYKGTLKTISADKSKVTLKVDKKDKTLDLAKNPMVVDDKGKAIKGGLAAVKPNSEVTAATEKKGDKEVVTKVTVTGPPKK